MRLPADFSFGADARGGWRRASDLLIRNVVAEAIDEGRGGSIEDAVWDALAGAPDATDRKHSGWLRKARDELIETSTPIAAVARAAGVHRVHFSRAFAQAFGLPPSAYRRRMRALRSSVDALNGRLAADSAYDAGFADQSHMAREIRRVTGLSYSRLRKLGAQVTSVQD